MAFADRYSADDERYVLAHWRGNLPLAQSYWLNGFLVSAVCTLLTLSASAAVQESDMSLTVISATAIFLVTFLLTVSVWSWVGIWRSASKSNSGWAALAKASVVLGVLGQLGQLGPLWEWGKETAYLAVGTDTLGEMAEVEAVGQELRISGLLTNGIAAKFVDMLNDNPDITKVRINSVGGRLLEASKIARLVAERELHVIVDQECSSACTVVLLAGKLRALEANSAVGFHRPTYPGLNRAELSQMADEMAVAYRRQGLRASFVSRVMEVPPEDMWYPTEAELFELRVLNGFTKARIADELAQDTKRENSRAPYRLDELTIFERAEHDDNIMRYFYKVDADASQFLPTFSKTIEKGLKEELCARAMMPEFLLSGAIYEHIYLDNAGRRAAAVMINSCQ